MEEPDTASDSKIIKPPKTLQTTVTAAKPVVTSFGHVERKPKTPGPLTCIDVCEFCAKFCAKFTTM